MCALQCCGTLHYLTKALRESFADEKKEHKAAVTRLQAEYDRLQSRLHAIYIDKLDGRIDKHFFEKFSGEWRVEQERCLRDIEWHQTADENYLDEGVRLLDMARGAANLFEKNDAHQKRRLLNFVLSNCSWKGGKLSANFRQPFDIIAQTATATVSADGLNLPEHSGWLGNLDSNQDRRSQSPLFYR